MYTYHIHIVLLCVLYVDVYLLYFMYTYCIILFTQSWAWSCFVGEPAEVHQCRLSGPPREQEQARAGGWDEGWIPRMHGVADRYALLILF